MVIERFQGNHRFLSNFAPVPIDYEGRRYPSVEHAYQAAKTLDEDWRYRIQTAETPGLAKRTGRYVPMRQDWETIKVAVMESFLRQKFARLDFRDKLLATGDAVLIERNDWGDRFWGQVDGVGENHLGKLLMKIREEYRCAR